MENKIAFCTVNYKQYKVLEEFLDCFHNQTDTNFHIYIADLTNQKDKQPILNVNSTTIIEGQNNGYGFGINLGIKQAIKDGISKFVVINNDVEFENDFVEKVRISLDNNKEALIGGKIYYAKGFEYHTDKYLANDLGKVMWYAGGSVDWKNVYISHRGVDEVDRGQYDNLENTEFVTGCLMLLNKNIIDKIGFFDESYFMYYEDADYCIRASKARVPLLYDPSVIIWHKNGQSTEGSGSEFQVKHIEKNRIKFGLKYAPWRTKFHLILNKFTRGSR